MTLLSGITSLFFVSCGEGLDWVSYRGENGSGYTHESIYPPLGQMWKLRLQDEGKAAKSFNPPVVKGDNIYFGSNDGNFYSLDLNSGYMNWIFKTAQAVNSVPFLDDDTVYFGSNDGTAYAVDQKTGKEKWRFRAGNPVQSLVLRYQDDVIFTSDTGATYFLSPEGKLKNRIPNPVWSHHTFQVFDGVVYWAPKGRNFGAYDIQKQAFLWTVNVNVPYAVWYSFPALDENRVYYASNYLVSGSPELRYYAVDRITGEPLWETVDRMNLGSRIPYTRDTVFMKNIDLLDYMAPSLYKDTVIFSSGDVFLRALDRSDGSYVWKKRLKYPTSSAPTIAGDRIYVGMRGSSFGQQSGNLSADPGSSGSGGDSPRLLCLSAENGEILWEIEVDGAVLSAPVIAGGRIIFGTENHRFYVLDEVL